MVSASCQLLGKGGQRGAAARAAAWSECGDSLVESTSLKKGQGYGNAGQGSQRGTNDGNRGGIVEVARYRRLAPQATKDGTLRRNMAALPGAMGRVRTALRQLERAGMILGAVATGVELVREIRIASSNGAPSGGETPARSSRSPSSRKTSVRSPASQSTRASRNNRTASKKTPGSHTVGTARSRPKVKKAGGTHSKANKMARSRASATKTRTSGRPRSSARK